MTVSPFSPDELAAWRARLLALHATLRGEMQALSNERAAEPGAETQRAREIEAAIVQADADLIADIALAVRRIDSGLPVPFGICARTGQPIEAERLELVPWTRWCAAAARRPARCAEVSMGSRN